jgi:hypothetical protein
VIEALPIRPTAIHRDTTFIAADWLYTFRRTITATPCLVTFVPTRYAGLLHRGEGDRCGIERYYYCGVLGIKSERNPMDTRFTREVSLIIGPN